LLEGRETKRQGRPVVTLSQKTEKDAVDVSAAWDADNQAWWDWYVGLADNTMTSVQRARQAPTMLRPDPSLSALGLEALADELSQPYDLSADAIARFNTEGFIKLPRVLSPEAVITLRRAIVRTLEAQFATTLDCPVGDGTPQVGRRFYSAEMVWLDDPIVRLFVLSPRIARISADLLGVRSVRLYHDNLMSKEPGCGRTPWHYDDHHFPLATQNVVTAWIAAQAIPEAMGPLAFAKGMDAWRLVADIPFNKTDTSYDRRVAETFRGQNVSIEAGEFDVGEVSFHHNLSFHTAGPNETAFSRCVLANTFFADGARVVDAPTMVSGDWRKFLPGVEPGGLAASPLNPICWPAAQNWADQQKDDA
ncbi:MAG: phytanoyl-CoA dioxygenase family protein, partial [Pseudomonadota bacterium]